MPPLFFVIALTILFGFVARHGTPKSDRVTVAAAVLLAVYVNVALWSTEWLAGQAASHVFVAAAGSMGVLSHQGVRIVRASRTQIIFSDGEQLARGASTTLQLMVFGCWIGLLILTFFGSRFVLARVAPALHSKYAKLFTQTERFSAALPIGA
jgi:hypothetical protein